MIDQPQAPLCSDALNYLQQMASDFCRTLPPSAANVTFATAMQALKETNDELTAARATKVSGTTT